MRADPWSEVPTDVAILHDAARHDSHKADNDFSAL